MSIINVEELDMLLIGLQHAKARLERNKQTGTAFRVGEAITNLEGVLEILKSMDKYDNCVYSEDLEKRSITI